MYRATVGNLAPVNPACPARRNSFNHAYKFPFLIERRLRRAFAYALNVGVLAFVFQAPPVTALVIGGEGWTADTPAGISYSQSDGTPLGGPAPGDGASPVLNPMTNTGSYTFRISLASAVGVSTTIKFTNDGTVGAGDESYFRLTFAGTNTGAIPWAGVEIVITDLTTDPIPVEAEDVDHPERAHIHRSVWTAGAFTCSDAYCGFDGRYDMTLLLGTPLAMGNSALGSTLRLHDINEAGTSPMSFNLTFTPIPTPGTVTLFGVGLACLIFSQRRRHAYSPGTE